RTSMRQSSSSSTNRMVRGSSVIARASSSFTLSDAPLRIALRRRRRRRQVLSIDREPERAPLAHFALDPDRAAVRFNDALHARQPSALARDVLHRRALAAAEYEEDLVQVLALDADSGVANVELDLAVAAHGAADVDLLDCLRRLIGAHVLDRVVDQVL